MKTDDKLILIRDYYIELFDFYGELLTTKQKKYFIDFYYNDYTLSEIASNNNISRSAVFDAIEKINKSLDDYEKILKLYSYRLKMENIFTEYEGKNGPYIDIINKIKNIEE